MYNPGDCVKSYNYRAWEMQGSWVACYSPSDCTYQLNSYGQFHGWGSYYSTYATGSTNYAWGAGAHTTYGRGCFPGDLLVEIQTVAPPTTTDSRLLSSLVPIASVRVGDLVRTGEGHFERVFAVTKW